MPTPLKHIVLADDDREDLEFFQDALKDNCPQVKITTAEDGGELLSVLDGNLFLPDVIVLDLNMPRVNGKDCLKAIRKNDRFEKVPVIVYSTSSSKNDRDECLLFGANYYVTKPGSLQAISSLVKKLCDGEMPYDSRDAKYA
jgi:CheY-like chemotaxis protein